MARDQYLDTLVRKRDNGRVKIVTGIRRCGKSYLLFELYRDCLLRDGVGKDQVIGLALDDVENACYHDTLEMNALVRERIRDGSRRYYIFIDEIQFSFDVRNPYSEDPGEKITFVDTVLGLMRVRNADIYVTRSNSKLLSKDVLTQFRDRGDEINVRPLSFAEFLPACRATFSRHGPSTARTAGCRTCSSSMATRRRADT